MPLKRDAPKLMFQTLSDRLEGIFRHLRNKGTLSEKDVDTALRDIRIALLEADVSLEAVKDFITGVREKAVGAQVLRSITPGQMIIKIVHDHLVQLLTHSEGNNLNFAAQPPVVILMVGLQGSGKTTTTAKLAHFLKKREHKKVLMASLDVYRPAAREQLKILGDTYAIPTLPLGEKESPLDIGARALEMAKRGGFDVLLVDTAGRLHVDAPLMEEIAAVFALLSPQETLLVADAMMGQDAVTMAQAFGRHVSLTGSILSRIDSDARGGAALSLCFMTGTPLKFLGTGEKVEDFEPFLPERLAGRILGRGDVVTFVEKMATTLEKEDREKAAQTLQKGSFTLEDMSTSLGQMDKMGGMGALMGMLPGMGKLAPRVDGDAQSRAEKTLKRQKAILSSMTPQERRTPTLLNASRKKRIAAGSGTSVPEVNRLLKQYEQMATLMKRMGKLGQKGSLARGFKKLFG